MAELSFDNPVFRFYVIAAALMVLKMIGTAWLTVYRVAHPPRDDRGRTRQGAGVSTGLDLEVWLGRARYVVTFHSVGQ